MPTATDTFPPFLESDDLPNLRPLTVGSLVTAWERTCFDCNTGEHVAAMIEQIVIEWRHPVTDRYEFFDCPKDWTIGAAVDMARTMAQVRGYDHWVDVEVVDHASTTSIAYFDRHGQPEQE